LQQEAEAFVPLEALSVILTEIPGPGVRSALKTRCRACGWRGAEFWWPLEDAVLLVGATESWEEKRLGASPDDCAFS